MIDAKDTKKIIKIDWNKIGAIATVISLVLGIIFWVIPTPYFQNNNTDENTKLFTSGTQSNDSASTSDKSTKIFFYAPPTHNDKIDYNQLISVKCWHQSVSAIRSDAYRCVGEGGIYDPCFSAQMKELAYCPNSPEDLESVFLLTFDQDFNHKEVFETDKTRPWYIRLNDGIDCRFITGATTVVAGMRHDYACSPGDVEGLFLPIIDDGGIKKISCRKGGHLEECDLKEMWF